MGRGITARHQIHALGFDCSGRFEDSVEVANGDAAIHGLGQHFVRLPTWSTSSQSTGQERSSGRPAAGNDDGFAERLQIFFLANRMHRPQLRQQVVDQRTQPRPRCTVRE